MSSRRITRTHNVSSGDRDSGSWIPWILFGLALGLGAIVASAWFSEDTIFKGMATIVIFVAIISSFRRRWQQKSFWLLVLLLVVAHFGLLWLFSIQNVTYDTKSRAIGLTVLEGLLFMTLIALFYGGKNFWKEIEF